MNIKTDQIVRTSTALIPVAIQNIFHGTTSTTRTHSLSLYVPAPDRNAVVAAYCLWLSLHVCSRDERRLRFEFFLGQSKFVNELVGNPVSVWCMPAHMMVVHRR